MYGFFDVVFVIAVLILVFQIGMTILPALLQRKQGTTSYETWIVTSLKSMFIKWIDPKKAKQIIWGTTFTIAIALGAFGYLINNSLMIGLFVVGLIAGRMAPRFAINYLIQRRIRQFNLQMVDGLSLLSNSLKSGLSVQQGLSHVVKQMPNPISEELNLVLSEQQVGISMEEAFINLGKRIPCEDVDMFVTSIIILKETGGNLTETFDTIVTTIRERIKIQQKISAMVSQGILQGVIIFLMPFGLGFAFYTIDPNHIRPMFETWLGLGLFGVMLILQLFGGLIMWKIVRIDV